MSTPSPLSPSTERTRRYRQRQRRGARCVTVEMNDVEITALVTKGYLADEARSDSKSIKSAIETLISDLAFELEQQAFSASGSRSGDFGKTRKIGNYPVTRHTTSFA